MPDWCHTCERKPARTTGPHVTWTEQAAGRRLYCTQCAAWYQQHTDSEDTP